MRIEGVPTKEPETKLTDIHPKSNSTLASARSFYITDSPEAFKTSVIDLLAA